jgi:hypothetical protein
MFSRLLKSDRSLKVLTRFFRHVAYDETSKVLTFTKRDGTTQTLTLT